MKIRINKDAALIKCALTFIIMVYFHSQEVQMS
jgi:hypothetical protein